MTKKQTAAVLSAILVFISIGPAWSAAEIGSEAMEPSQQSCPFCGIPNNLVPENRVIDQTPLYSITASQGTMGVEGYLLQIPSDHVESLSRLSVDAHKAFFKSTKKIVTAVTEAYGPPVLLEHGVTGQSIEHAHLHILPGVKFDKVVAETERLLCEGGEDCSIWKRELAFYDESWPKREAKTVTGGYLYLADPASNRAVVFAVKPETKHLMILRKAAAAALDRPELAEWKKARANPELAQKDEAQRQRTIDRLKGRLSPKP